MFLQARVRWAISLAMALSLLASRTRAGGSTRPAIFPSMERAFLVADSTSRGSFGSRQTTPHLAVARAVWVSLRVRYPQINLSAAGTANMRLGQRGRPGARVFVAIGGLLGDDQSLMHDQNKKSGFPSAFVSIMMAQIKMSTHRV